MNIENLKRLAEAGEAANPAAVLELIRQRDELLAAAKLVRDWFEAENDHTKEPDFYKRMEMSMRSEEAIKEAIAKVEG